MVAGTKKKIHVLNLQAISNSKKNSVLSTENLQIGYSSKKHKNVVASGIDIAVHEGELVALVGVNGVGKSTFLRTISGVQPALEGTVFINSTDRKTIPAPQLASLISLVLTEQPISKNLTVTELIALGRQPYTNWLGTINNKDREQISEVIGLVGIEDIQHKKCYELSDGQLQKVLIARALAQDTPVVILDEPTSHLDIYHKAQVLKLLKKLSQHTKKAILFATHEINLAIQLCDKIILMQKEKVQQGSPEELIEAKAFDRVFPQDLIFFDRTSNSFKIKT